MRGGVGKRKRRDNPKKDGEEDNCIRRKEELEQERYMDKIWGCWLGKCLGGAIGMPFEGVPFPVSLKEEDIFIRDVPNDDLELQLVWMDAIRRYGTELTSRKLTDSWLNKIQHGCDEYSIAIHNMKHGILPPASGWHNNFFADGMGAVIRSEIWALLFAGRPDAAGYFACQDAQADHWGNGVWGEIFMAEAEAYACVHSNIEEALCFALGRLDHHSRLYQTTSKVYQRYVCGMEEERARELLMRQEQRISNFTDCVMNLSFIVHSLLYGGGDFLKTILTAISFGRDTDCTGASCGAFLGIALGKKAIPEKWASKVKNELALSDYVARIPGVPLTMDDLVKQTAQLKQSLAVELPEREYPGYIPYEPKEAVPEIDRSQWLILDEDHYNIHEIEAEIRKTGKCPAALRGEVHTFSSLFLDLSSCAGEYNTLHLFSFLERKRGATEETVISVTADVGMTLYIDGMRLLNHHSRQKMLPSFHRAEGGASFLLPIENERSYFVHWVLYNCAPPLKACIMFGNLSNDHLDGFEFRI